jgi:hypothetical protein
MKLLHALLPACALLLPCVLAAQSTFEGKVTMQVSSPSKDGPQSLNYSIKDGLVRIDVNTSRGQAGMIMDSKNHQMIILMAQQQMYMIQPFGDNPGNPQASQYGAPADHPAGAPGNGSFTNTGIKEDILGYTCTKLVVASDKASADIWVTDQLGSFAGLFQGGPGRRQAPAAWETALKGVGFFPMRVVSTQKDGKVFKLEVTSVEKTSLPDSLFSPPEGWRKFDMGAMMGGAGGFGGFGGGRPTGGSN